MLRRRLVALALIGAAVAAAGFAVASVRDNGKQQPATTATAPPRPFKVVFPEGFTRRQMAERVAAVAEIAQHERNVVPRLSSREYLGATRRPRLQPGFGRTRLPLEGFLFPATYQFTAKTTAAQLVAAQLRAFRKNWAQVNLRYARSKKLTAYDVLIIASMVEKEAAAPEERALIAAVIYNRLHDGMKLGIDATIRYALNVSPTESLRVSQLHARTPYNTRDFYGLPPTPIANPGLASIQAAAHPAHVKYLYFVRKPDKLHHYFTASEQDFIAYERKHGYR